MIMRLSYKRTADTSGTWYAVTADDDTPTTYVRKNGRAWQRATEPGSWWGTYRTREEAARDGVEGARQDRDRGRAYDVLGHMDLRTSFDQCSGPLDTWSDGAQWCVRVWDDAREAFDENQDADDDTASERADALTPIYTGHVWRVWCDLTAYSAERAEESGKGEGESVTNYAMGVLCDLARDAMTTLFNEWREALTCDECDEYPCECDDDDDAEGCTCTRIPGSLDYAECEFCASLPAYRAHALPDLPPAPVPDTPQCTRCTAPVADAGLTGTLCGECTDRMHAETAPDPVCCLHCPDGCDGAHDPFCGHCHDGCC